jgi:hypothetical protein
MTECLALDLAKLSPRLARLIEVKAREWGCSPEVAAIQLLDQAASSATQPQQAAASERGGIASLPAPFHLPPPP